MAQSSDVRLKLVIDRKTERVLYGEADKKFIDFLFNLLSLPLGAAIKVLKKDGMVGSLGNLYESVETLNESYLLPNQSRDTIIKPNMFFNSSTKVVLPNIIISGPLAAAAATPPATIYSQNVLSYGSCSDYSSISSRANNLNAAFGHLSQRGTSSLMPPNVGNQPAAPGSGRGFVKDLATYIVMDDLTVMHISDFSITTLFKKFNVMETDSLEEKVITLDVNQGVELLEASLQSKTVLTNAFLKRRRPHFDSARDVKFSV